MGYREIALDYYGGVAGIPTDSFINLDADNPLNTNERWFDLSLNDHLVNQTITANQPILTTNQINGHSAYVFDGTELMSSVLGTVYSQPISWFIVHKISSSPLTQSVLYGKNLTSEMYFYVSGGTFRFGTPAEISYPFTRDNWVVTTVVRRGVYFDFYENNTLKASGFSLNYTLSELIVGAFGGGLLKLNGSIANIIGYNRELSNDEVVQIQTDLLTKYGL